MLRRIQKRQQPTSQFATENRKALFDKQCFSVISGPGMLEVGRHFHLQSLRTMRNWRHPLDLIKIQPTGFKKVVGCQNFTESVVTPYCVDF